jgi:hypothetical protein
VVLIRGANLPFLPEAGLLNRPERREGGCIMHIPLVTARYITSMKYTRGDFKVK